MLKIKNIKKEGDKIYCSFYKEDSNKELMDCSHLVLGNIDEDKFFSVHKTNNSYYEIGFKGDFDIKEEESFEVVGRPFIPNQKGIKFTEEEYNELKKLGIIDGDD